MTPAAYVRAFDAYCAAATRAIRRLGATPIPERDPVRPVEVLADRYRGALERLARRTPPAQLRAAHLLVLAQGRESADRIDDGVRLGRAGDVDAATTALGELAGLLPDPDTLPLALREGAPTCSPGTS